MGRGSSEQVTFSTPHLHLPPPHDRLHLAGTRGHALLKGEFPVCDHTPLMTSEPMIG